MSPEVCTLKHLGEFSTLEGEITPFFHTDTKAFPGWIIFLSQRWCQIRVEECTIGTCLLSDQADTSITVPPPSSQPMPLVAKPLASEQSFRTLQDTLKAYLRGSIISYSTARKREVLREQLNLERQLDDLDKQVKDSDTATLLKKSRSHSASSSSTFDTEGRVKYLIHKTQVIRNGRQTRTTTCIFSSR